MVTLLVSFIHIITGVSLVSITPQIFCLHLFIIPCSVSRCNHEMFRNDLKCAPSKVLTIKYLIYLECIYISTFVLQNMQISAGFRLKYSQVFVYSWDECNLYLYIFMLQVPRLLHTIARYRAQQGQDLMRDPAIRRDMKHRCLLQLGMQDDTSHL